MLVGWVLSTGVGNGEVTLRCVEISSADNHWSQIRDIENACQNWGSILVDNAGCGVECDVKDSNPVSAQRLVACQANWSEGVHIGNSFLSESHSCVSQSLHIARQVDSVGAGNSAVVMVDRRDRKLEPVFGRSEVIDDPMIDRVGHTVGVTEDG